MLRALLDAIASMLDATTRDGYAKNFGGHVEDEGGR
jgi:hypothetical protein